jgi:glycerophosphoryl diester phosphodiesterase
VLAPPFARPDRPVIWAHRGASAEAPENTLAAFRLAAAQGADGVELDAQLCGSGEVVCFHDATLGRTTGQSGLLEETPWSVLRTLDAGGRLQAQHRGERVPLLAEVLAELPRGLLVNIELKCERPDDRGLTAAVVQLVRAAAAEERVLLSSFNPLCLWRARALAPGLPRALLFASDQPPWLRHPLAARPLWAAALHPEGLLVTPARAARWRRRGYTLAAWTVDEPAEAERLWSAGVSGLITNRPAALRAALGAVARPDDAAAGGLR